MVSTDEEAWSGEMEWRKESFLMSVFFLLPGPLKDSRRASMEKTTIGKRILHLKVRGGHNSLVPPDL